MSEAAVADLLRMLDLEKIEENIFRGVSPQTGWQRVFGGLVVSQALVACCRTVEGIAPHSLHGYFILGGDPRAPIVYEVDRLRDGRSFATRRCVAIQHGRAIFTLAASFQREEPAPFEHATQAPPAPRPEDLPSESELVARFGAALPAPLRRYFERDQPIEFRPCDLSRYLGAKPKPGATPTQQVWMRTTGRLPDDPAIHRVVLAYLSDMTLLDTGLVVQGRSIFDPRIAGASLDHAVWLHRPFRADDWLLYAQDNPSSSGARALTRGMIFDRAGRHVASVAQEGLLRERPPMPA